jgi:hypothetical protein
MRSIVLRCVLLAMAPAVALCDGYFRCGQSLVSADVSVAELLQKCGNPSTTRVSFVDIHTENGIKVGTSKIETWRYDRGTRASAMIVTVADGKIEKIESEVDARESESPQ